MSSNVEEGSSTNIENHNLKKSSYIHEPFSECELAESGDVLNELVSSPSSLNTTSRERIGSMSIITPKDEDYLFNKRSRANLPSKNYPDEKSECPHSRLSSSGSFKQRRESSISERITFSYMNDIIGESAKRNLDPSEVFPLFLIG